MIHLILITWVTLSFAPAMAGNYSGKVLIVSMDGFQWNYLDRVDTPNFDEFARQGVKLPYMNNSFVTKTFPNHYTMITGLYEETHGIIENHMYDPVFNSTFSPRNREPRWWNGGEPVWVTAKNQGLKTATYYWPGSEIPIRGVRPDISFNYSDSPPFNDRIDTVVDWFKTQGVSMATLYFPEPDKTGHIFGPDSQEIRDKVKEMDDVLGYLMKKMKENDLDNEVNVIVTSDHGMIAIDNVHRVINVTDHVNMSMVHRIPSDGPVMHIQPIEGAEDNIIESLKNVPHITVYRKEDIPDHFHYKHNRRIMPIVILAEKGWLITKDKEKQAKLPTKGEHGYDNELMAIKPIFLARGPDFKVDFQSDPIKNVDLYPLMCKLLNINPSVNNGSLERVSRLIKEPHGVNDTSGLETSTELNGPTSGGTAIYQRESRTLLLHSLIFLAVIFCSSKCFLPNS